MASEAQIKANTKYQSKAYDRILLRVSKGNRDKIQLRAKQLGMSVNSYILHLIDVDISGEPEPEQQQIKQPESSTLTYEDLNKILIARQKKEQENKLKRELEDVR